MSAAELVSTMALADYVAWEEVQASRHELVGGRAYAMSGGTERHSLMRDVIGRAIGPGALAAGCRAFGSDRKLVTPPGNAYYPDYMVCCGKAGNIMYETDAALVVEVLSPSTREIDKREKSQSYGSLASIAMYVVVEPDIRHLEVATWVGGEIDWAGLGPGGTLVTPYAVLDLDGLYNELDRIASS